MPWKPPFLTSALDGAVLSFTFRPFHPRGKRPQYPSAMKLGGMQSRYGRRTKEKSFASVGNGTPVIQSDSCSKGLALPAMGMQFACRLADSTVFVTSLEISQLRLRKTHNVTWQRCSVLVSSVNVLRRSWLWISAPIFSTLWDFGY
jgi:hypothetical protein